MSHTGGAGEPRAAIREAPMFCPSCGTQIPNGSRFCRSCGANLSARCAATPQATARVPASGVSAFIRRAPAARGLVEHGRLVAGIVAIALVIAVGLNTGWLGLAQPHLTPGTYTLSGSSTSDTTTLSVSQGDRVSLTIEGASLAGGNARVSQAGGNHLHVQVPITTKGSQPSDYSYNLVIPRGAPDSIVGSWAGWISDRNGQPYGDLGWAKIESDGTLRFGSISSSSDAVTAAKSLMAGAFQGGSKATSGRWTRQGNGSFQLTTSYGYTLTLSYHK